jgi:hypothetical protein
MVKVKLKPFARGSGVQEGVGRADASVLKKPGSPAL